MLESSVTNPHFAFTYLSAPRILVSYQGTLPPDENEVRNYNQVLRSIAEQPDVRCLWYTEGARPSREQQERLAAAVPKHQWLVALLSPSPEMRFIASAFSLVNRNLRYFTAQELPLALRHLQCTPDEQSEVQLVLAELRHAVEPPQDDPVLERHA
ncbi:MAG TPA: hypothetical protein VFG30_14065 [Polyangiales bacterium]|nr:hypothetical protein [Polyangiales bacterium]